MRSHCLQSEEPVRQNPAVTAASCRLKKLLPASAFWLLLRVFYQNRMVVSHFLGGKNVFSSLSTGFGKSSGKHCRATWQRHTSGAAPDKNVQLLLKFQHLDCK